MNSIFTKIIKGELPCYKVYEDDHVIAFLDIYPVVRGHTLVVPKREAPHITDYSSEELQNCMIAVQNVIEILTNRLGCQGCNLLQSNGAVAGQEIDHVHFHILPRWDNDGVTFGLSTNKNEQELLKQTHEKLLSHQ